MVKIIDLIVPTLKNLAAGHSFWVVASGNPAQAGVGLTVVDPFTKVGITSDTNSGSGSTLLAAATTEPAGGPGSGWWDVSAYTALCVHFDSAAQTGSAALVLFVAELWPNEQNSGGNGIWVACGPSGGSIATPAAFAAGAKTQGAVYLGLGASAPNVTGVARRMRRLALAFGATTFPSADVPVSISIWGVDDGQAHRR